MSVPDSNDDGAVTGINVTPMVDVMLVLLIIFMVTTQFVSESVVKIHLPKAAMAEESSTASVTVSIDEQGELFLMEKTVDLNGLRANLAREVTQNSDVRVILAADGQIPYRQVMSVLDAIKQSGVARVALASEPTAER